MKKIAILSDTHGILRPQVLAECSIADYIIHAGDINTPAIVDKLRSFGETYIVRGNNDKDWAVDLPQSLSITIDGMRFFILHNKKDVPKDLTGFDVVVYGHSHQYCAEMIDDVLWLNPGSCGRRRFDLEITMSMVVVDEGRIMFEKKLISNETQTIHTECD